MSNYANKSDPIAEIFVVDRRNTAKVERSMHKILLVQKATNFIVFMADWQFPVPATRRRYFWGKRELTVEECGKVPGRNLFQFTGIHFSQKFTHKRGTIADCHCERYKKASG